MDYKRQNMRFTLMTSGFSRIIYQWQSLPAGRQELEIRGNQLDEKKVSYI